MDRIIMNGKYLYQDGRLLRLRNDCGFPSNTKSAFSHSEIGTIIAVLNKKYTKFEINLEQV